MYGSRKMENRHHGYKSFTQINKWHEKKLFCLNSGCWAPPYFNTFFYNSLTKWVPS